jgi:predicted porin
MRRTSDPATTYLILLGPSAGSTFTTRAGIHVSTNINDGLQSSFSNSTDQMQWKLDFIAERFNTGWTGYIENITQGLTYSFTDILTPSTASENIYFKGSNTVMPFALGDQVKLTLKYAFNENQL